MQKDLQKAVQKLSPMQKIMQRRKNGIDAENGADEFAERDAEVVQNLVQSSVQNGLQMMVQNPVQPQRGDLFIEGALQSLPVAPAERPVHLVNRSLRWSYSNRWLTVIYKQVAPSELRSRAVARADEYAEPRADCCAVLL